MLSSLIEILELATVVLLFSCALDLRKGIEVPKKEEAKPKKMVKKKLTKEDKKKQECLQTLMDNIDNYNGDGIGQKEVK